MPGRTGPHRQFDTDQVLEAATQVFWRYGYDATSIAMLTTHLGINPPSLYAAFGGKQELFLRVVEHYNSTHGRFMADAFDEEHHAHALITRLLHVAAENYGDARFPGGCLVVSATTNFSPNSRDVAKVLKQMRLSNVQQMAERFAAAADDGELPRTVNARALAMHYAAVLQGMSQQARDGATIPELHEIADLALASWPGLSFDTAEPLRQSAV